MHNAPGAYASGTVYIKKMLLVHIELRILPQIIHALGAAASILEHNFGPKSHRSHRSRFEFHTSALCERPSERHLRLATKASL